MESITIHVVRGFATLEIVIALGIISFTVGSIALLGYEGRSSLLGGSLQDEALIRAQTLIENSRASTHSDSRLLSDVASSSDGIFTSSLTTGDSSYDSYMVHTATARVAWSDRFHTDHQSVLTTAMTDYMNAGAYDTCAALGGDWTTPTIENHQVVPGGMLSNTPPAGHTFSTRNSVSSVDVYRGIMSVTIATTSAKSNDSFFTIDVHSDHAWKYLGGIDTNNASIDGLESIAGNGYYVFAANGHTANWSTCKTGPSCAQLQVIDISAPSQPRVVANFTIPTSTTPFVTGLGGQAVGKSITLIGNYVYLGLTKSATGPEFNIIDVHDPLHPVWVGGYTVGAGVSAIDVRRGFAYVASDSATHELLILDVHNPASPVLAGSYNVYDSRGWGNGNSVYSIGTSTYLGLTFAAGAPDLYVLDTFNRSTPTKVSTSKISSTIAGLIARSTRAFLLTTTAQSLYVFAVSNAQTLTLTNTIALPGVGRVMDCERNTLYIGSNATSGVITLVQPRL